MFPILEFAVLILPQEVGEIMATDGGGNDGTDSENKGSVVMRLMKISNFLQ